MILRMFVYNCHYFFLGMISEGQVGISNTFNRYARIRVQIFAFHIFSTSLRSLNCAAFMLINYHDKTNAVLSPVSSSNIPIQTCMTIYVFCFPFHIFDFEFDGYFFFTTYLYVTFSNWKLLSFVEIIKRLSNIQNTRICVWKLTCTFQ